MEIRREVFVAEQSVPEEIEIDGQDASSMHFLAVNELGQYIGCARLLPTGQIGRMAVRKTHRGTGIGARLLQACVLAAQEKGFDRVFLHAQSYAEEFYQKGGFIRFGDEFSEAGIAHVAMEMKLALPFAPSDTPERAEPSAQVSQVAPRTQPAPPPAHFADPDDAVRTLTSVVQSASRHLCLLHPNLDQDVFADSAFVDAVSALARSAPRVSIRLLVLDMKLMVERGHPLLNLARRLDENLHIRVLTERPSSETSSFAAADGHMYWLVPNWEVYEGICEMDNPVTAKRLREVFNQAWEKSTAPPDLRRLSI